MGRAISDYEKGVMARIEEIRTLEAITMEGMADLMEISLDQYKRFAKYSARITIESIYKFAKNYPVDIDYIIFGEKRQGGYTFINAMTHETFESRANMYMELARYYKKRQHLYDKSKGGSGTPITDDGVDFEIDENTIIETNNKK